MTFRKERPRDRRGNYAMLSGFAMTAIVGFGALSIDISLITLAELQAQAAADAASHAALIGFRQNLDTSDGDAAAQWIVEHNKVAMGTATIAPGYPRYGQWNYNTQVFTPDLVNGNANAAEVRLLREDDNAVELLLAPILGVTEHEVRAESITSTQLRAIMLAVDMSCSMMGSASSVRAVDYNRLGALTFLDYFVEHPQEGDMIGMSMFAQFANRTPTGPYPYGQKVSSDFPAVTTDRPWAPLALVEDDEAVLRPRFMGICNTDAGTPDSRYPTNAQCRVGGAPNYNLVYAGGTVVARPRQDTNGGLAGTGNGIGRSTNPEPAVRQAVNELVDKTDGRYFRGIVFMSDGVPNVPDEDTAKADALAAADLAWENDISIWSMLYHNGTFDDAFMQDMVRGSGYFLSSPDAADLPAMYEQVAKSIPTALVY